ncbi:hypothetical protein J437_LFUL019141 [Ladona fulva]|uniref:Metalloendopeptidase n=1 Tax=Ladona fulva TaxID=123851 RepID=A0A8K0P828_LADFU|nr:hypothetical protein J437_LFUL019141 [Ladona fulva]
MGYGKQNLSLDDGCVQKGVIIHELLHAVGFWHEQSRADRNDHVTILWRNIQSGSIMHYGPYSFSKYKTSPTILPKEEGVSIGQRFGFSEKVSGLSIA